MSSFYLKKWISTEIQSWAKLRHKAVLYPMESHRVSFLCGPSFPSVYTISAMFESYRTIGQTRKGDPLLAVPSDSRTRAIFTRDIRCIVYTEEASGEWIPGNYGRLALLAVFYAPACLSWLNYGPPVLLVSFNKQLIWYTYQYTYSPVTRILYEWAEEYL